MEPARILVLDDDTDTRDVEYALLTREGHCVVTAGSVSEAMHVLRTHPPDLVFTDFALPGADGFELLRRLRSNPHLSSIPVVLVTAHAEPRLRAEALGEGFADVVTKPFDPSSLADVAQRVLAARYSGVSA